MTLTRNRLIAVVLAALLLIGLSITASQVLTAQPANAVQPSIPHCVNDDYNDGTQPICYTVRVTDGQYILINSSDVVVADMSSEKTLLTCAVTGTGHWCKFPTSLSANGWGIRSWTGDKWYN